MLKKEDYIARNGKDVYDKSLFLELYKIQKGIVKPDIDLKWSLDGLIAKCRETNNRSFYFNIHSLYENYLFIKQALRASYTHINKDIYYTVIGDGHPCKEKDLPHPLYHKHHFDQLTSLAVRALTKEGLFTKHKSREGDLYWQPNEDNAELVRCFTKH